jgi:hypothetical protein
MYKLLQTEAQTNNETNVVPTKTEVQTANETIVVPSKTEIQTNKHTSHYKQKYKQPMREI